MTTLTRPLMRLATPEDAEGVLAIYRPYVESNAVSFEYETPSVDAIRKRISKTFEKHVWIVVEWGTDIVGFAYASDYRTRAAYQYVAEVSVYVHDGYGRRNIAHALYDALHRLLKTQGYIVTKAVMTHPNPKSEAFHEKYGYKLEAKFDRIGFKFSEWHDVAYYNLDLRDRTQAPSSIKYIDQLDSNTINTILYTASLKIKIDP